MTVGVETLECAVRLVAAAERFCVNLDTLRGGTDVATRTTVEAP